MESIQQGWYRQQNSDTVIVLIHGLFSNHIKCWSEPEKKSYWPKLISEDQRFSNIDIFLANFHTAISATDNGISQCVSEVLTQLKTQDSQLNSPPIDRKNIIFLAHSAGGIIARYILDSQRKLFLDKRIALALYASPSYGSKVASTFGGVASFFKNKLAQELSWGSHILEDLDDRFRDLLESNELNIVGIEAYENKSPFHVSILNQSNSRIVEKLSASRYFGKPRLIAETNHSSIVKPLNIEARSHVVFCEFLQGKSFINIHQKKVTQINLHASIPSTSEKPNVLFDFYDLHHETVYIEREDDRSIIHNLGVNGLWVCGRTGVGKTVSIQRAIKKNNSKIKYISLSVCIHESLEVIFNEIYFSFLSDEQSQEIRPIREVLKLLTIEIDRHCHEEDIMILIEEIPIKDQATFIKFSEYIYALISNLKKVNKCKLILSSIFEPAVFEGNEFDKILENFRIIKSSIWSDEDMNRLVTLIITELNLDQSEVIDISKFQGCPRTAKKYFRDIKFRGSK